MQVFLIILIFIILLLVCAVCALGGFLFGFLKKSKPQQTPKKEIPENKNTYTDVKKDYENLLKYDGTEQQE